MRSASASAWWWWWCENGHCPRGDGDGGFLFGGVAVAVEPDGTFAVRSDDPRRAGNGHAIWKVEHVMWQILFSFFFLLRGGYGFTQRYLFVFFS